MCVSPCIVIENDYHLAMDAPIAKSSPQIVDATSIAELQLRGPTVPCVRSDSLFGRSREILIEHCGCYYRLRVTHSNKLILTK